MTIKLKKPKAVGTFDPEKEIDLKTGELKEVPLSFYIDRNIRNRFKSHCAVIDSDMKTILTNMIKDRLKKAQA